MKQFSIDINSWQWSRRHEIRMWLVENFGAHGDQWREETSEDYLPDERLIMNEDAYTMYLLRWS
jgi:hypothetical protein